MEFRCSPPQFLPFTMHGFNTERKKWGALTLLSGESARDWPGCSGRWPSALHLLLTQPLPAVWLQLLHKSILSVRRAQMATRITVMARWMPLLSISLSVSATHTHTHAHTSPPALMLICEQTHKQAKSSSFSKCVPEHNHKQNPAY